MELKVLEVKNAIVNKMMALTVWKTDSGLHQEQVQLISNVVSPFENLLFPEAHTDVLPLFCKNL